MLAHEEYKVETRYNSLSYASTNDVGEEPDPGGCPFEDEDRLEGFRSDVWDSSVYAEIVRLATCKSGDEGCGERCWGTGVVEAGIQR